MISGDLRPDSLFFLQQNQEEVRYQSGTGEIDFSNPVYGDNRNAATPKPSNKEWVEKLKKDSDGLVRNNLDPTYGHQTE